MKNNLKIGTIVKVTATAEQLVNDAGIPRECAAAMTGKTGEVYVARDGDVKLTPCDPTLYRYFTGWWVSERQVQVIAEPGVHWTVTDEPLGETANPFTKRGEPKIAINKQDKLVMLANALETLKSDILNVSDTTSYYHITRAVKILIANEVLKK